MLSFIVNFGKHLEHLMEKSGMRPSELAKMMSVSPSYVSQLLSSHRNPGRETLFKLSKAFGVSVETLTPDKSALHVTGIKEEPTLYNRVDPITEKVNLMLRDMNDAEKREVLKYAQDKKLISNLRKKKTG